MNRREMFNVCERALQEFLLVSVEDNKYTSSLKKLPKKSFNKRTSNISNSWSTKDS